MTLGWLGRRGWLVITLDARLYALIWSQSASPSSRSCSLRHDNTLPALPRLGACLPHVTLPAR